MFVSKYFCGWIDSDQNCKQHSVRNHLTARKHQHLTLVSSIYSNTVCLYVSFQIANTYMRLDVIDSSITYNYNYNLRLFHVHITSSSFEESSTITDQTCDSENAIDRKACFPMSLECDPWGIALNCWWYISQVTKVLVWLHSWQFTSTKYRTPHVLTLKTRSPKNHHKYRLISQFGVIANQCSAQCLVTSFL